MRLLLRGGQRLAADRPSEGAAPRDTEGGLHTQPLLRREAPAARVGRDEQPQREHPLARVPLLAAHERERLARLERGARVRVVHHEVQRARGGVRDRGDLSHEQEVGPAPPQRGRVGTQLEERKALRRYERLPACIRPSGQVWGARFGCITLGV